jgi:hypothetical protein
MALSFFRTTEVLQFAETVVSEYDRLSRSTAVRHDSPEKRQLKMEKLRQKVHAYSSEHKLNFYKKSKMLFAIKQGMEAKSVPEQDVNAFLSSVLAKGLKR